MNLPDSVTPTRIVFPLLVAGKVVEGVRVQAEVTEVALLPWGLALGNIKQTRKKHTQKMATMVIHHLSTEAHPSPQRRADTHSALPPPG